MILGIALIGSGCEEDSARWDGELPPGDGRLVVDNRTVNDLAIYIDGRRQDGEVDGFDADFWDLKPGVYRVLLDERGGSRSDARFVDILEGRRTIMRVSEYGYGNEYDVDLFID